MHVKRATEHDRGRLNASLAVKHIGASTGLNGLELKSASYQSYINELQKAVLTFLYFKI